MRTINVGEPPYNARGDGSDETAKIQSAITALNAAGGGTLWFPRTSRNVYGVRSVPGSALFTLSKLNGVKVAGDGVTINDLTSHYFAVARLTSAGTTTAVRLATVTTAGPHGLSSGHVVVIHGAGETEYNGLYRIVVTSPTQFTYVLVGTPPSAATGNIQVVSDAVMFKFATCTNTSVTGIRFTAARKPDYVIPHGLTFVSFEQGSATADLHLSFDGGYAGLALLKQRRDPESYRSSLIRAQIKADHVERPYLAYYSGDTSDIQIDSNWGGRDFMLVGARGNKIVVTTTNQQGSSEIDQQSGIGNEDIDVRISNHDSTRQIPSNPQLLIQWADAVPAAVRRIKVVLDVAYTGGTPSGAACAIWKTNAGSADYAGRGHVIDGLDVSGAMAPWAGVDLVAMKGAFKAPDTVRGVRFHDIKSTKSSSAHPKGINFAAGDALQDTIELSNIDAPASQINVTNTTGRVVQRNVVARDLTLRSDDTSPQDFIGCTALDGSFTSVTNKRISRTSIRRVEINQ